jgi:hypothetical protein
MRHLGSIALSVVFAVVIYPAIGIGLIKFSEVHPATGGTHYLTATYGIAAMAVAGILIAVLMLTRLSPLGPLVAGLLLAGVTAWGLVGLSSLRDRAPKSILGMHGAALAPVGGAALLVAIPLILTVFSARRWYRYAQQGAPAPVEPDEASPLAAWPIATGPDAPSSPDQSGRPSDLGDDTAVLPRPADQIPSGRQPEHASWPPEPPAYPEAAPVGPGESLSSGAQAGSDAGTAGLAEYGAERPGAAPKAEEHPPARPWSTPPSQAGAPSIEEPEDRR